MNQVTKSEEPAPELIKNGISKMPSPTTSKWSKWIGGFVLIAIVLSNIFIAFHAWNATHFVNQDELTNIPLKESSFSQKMKKTEQEKTGIW